MGEIEARIYSSNGGGHHDWSEIVFRPCSRWNFPSVELILEKESDFDSHLDVCCLTITERP
jgi:hypothetical protein